MKLLGFLALCIAPFVGQTQIVAEDFTAQDFTAQGFGKAERVIDWHFHLGDIKYGGRQALNHSSWPAVTVPHDWSVQYPASQDLASCTGYLPGGIAWYRTDLHISESSKAPEEKDKRFYLYFGGVYNNSEVFINGKWLSKRPNGYVSYMVDLTPYVNPSGKNVVAVRVDHSQSADSRWYTGSGIYRDVYLVTANPVHIGQWGVYCTASVTEQGAELNVETQIKNHEAKPAAVEVVHELLDPLGESVATVRESIEVSESVVTRQQMTIENPLLWDLDSPNLYSLQTTVVRDGTVTDASTTRVGIRSLTFDPNHGFALNGKWTKIKGVCLHHDAGVLGAAVPKQVWHDRLLRLKEIGCNGIRTSHNPQSTELYDLCDELGMLVMDEAFDEWEYPKKKWLEGWNVGTPGFQGSADYFRTWGKQDLESMVRRDRNHPSIIMWSIGNEVDYPNDPYSHPILNEEGIGQKHVAGYQDSQPHADRLGEIAQELAAVVRKFDRSRPVTAALAGAVMSNETDYPAALDVIGYNYTEDRYEMDHQKYPERVLYGSETSSGLDSWNAVVDNDFVFGQFIWTGIDYLGESHRWPSRGFTTGLIDLSNRIKPRGYFRKSLWTDEPMAYLVTQPRRERRSRSVERRSRSAPLSPHWDYQDGQQIRVVCYTNGDAADLLLDGEKVGTRQSLDPETRIIEWTVPYQAGELEVAVYRDDKEVANDTLKTSDRPSAIKVDQLSGTLHGRHDVALVYLRVVDSQGNFVYLADNDITCSVRGNGRLIGLENGSNNVTEVYTDNHHQCQHGQLLAYIQATADSGEIDVEFSSPLLESERIELTIAAELE
ncbi:Beta-galactosidase [Planctomycetes bacterium CA13]|uniref:Beta-galactosidase n=2 Tax=Novipirellula herctigrandis TaxID=2527986 RepID=A0A5C5Z6H5_9BACT|nr:Beta-galactosidase [Planctomycetes bacterium CA13]